MATLSVIEISKTLPIPMRSGAGINYPWAEMAIGDSALIPMSRNTVKISLWRFTKRHGWKFTTRAEPGGVRVWRTA
jgi:hypothetical protein